MIFQDLALCRHMTVQEHIHFVHQPNGIPKKEARSEIDALDLIGTIENDPGIGGVHVTRALEYDIMDNVIAISDPNRN